MVIDLRQDTNNPARPYALSIALRKSYKRSLLRRQTTAFDISIPTKIINTAGWPQLLMLMAMIIPMPIHLLAVSDFRRMIVISATTMGVRALFLMTTTGVMMTSAHFLCLRF